MPNSEVLFHFFRFFINKVEIHRQFQRDFDLIHIAHFTGKNECPLCYVRSLLGRCMKICNTKDIEKYRERTRRYNPKKNHKESMFIKVQRNILDVLKGLFEVNPRSVEKKKAAIKWFKDLFKSNATASFN